MAWTAPVEVGTATLSKDTIDGYQKNGITVDGAGSTANITSDTITGAGPTTQIAQNGIQVSFGAQAKISKSTVTGNECNHPVCGADSLKQEQATGVLFYGAAPNSTVASSTIDENDIGVYAKDLLAKEPATPQAAITSDKLAGDRYEGVVIDQGWATVNGDTISNGNVGIQLLQFEGQSYGPKGTASSDTISGMTNWGVQGYSDNLPGDAFGQFTITNSKISGNPGPTVAESVNTNNEAKLKIFTTKSDT
jgi:hypothetical protein